MESSLNSFMPTLILMLFAVIMVVGALLVGKLIRPHRPTQLKETPYECGELPTGSAWSAFNIRFYVVGLIFIIFDVESVLLFPVAAVYRKFTEIGEGGVVFLLFVLFVSILIEGIVYCWKKGDLDWVRSFQRNDQSS